MGSDGVVAVDVVQLRNRLHYIDGNDAAMFSN